MVPATLANWTYKAIDVLCAAGQSESDRHDFKFNLPTPENLTKICCAFANTFGGFVVAGVGEDGPGKFKIVGLDPDKELYRKFIAKVKADPDITISPPKMIGVPGSAKLLYVFEVPLSPRRPHLPMPVDQRVFWKRQGSDCAQMTLEEIRYQMNTYEEKREKLALLLIDLQNKVSSLAAQCELPDTGYSGDIYSFEIIDRVVVEAYAILKSDISIFKALETIKQALMLLNADKEMMLTMLTLSYRGDRKTARIDQHRKLVRKYTPHVTALAQQIERSLKENFGIVNPYAVQEPKPAAVLA